MKIVLVLLIASLGLAGCGSTDFFGNSDGGAPVTPVADSSVQAQATPPPTTASTSPQEVASAPVAQTIPSQEMSAPTEPAASAERMPVTQDATAPVAQAATSPSAHCTTLAKQRAQDAAFQGEEPDTQEAVYNRTYSDCVAWDLKHRL